MQTPVAAALRRELLQKLGIRKRWRSDKLSKTTLTDEDLQAHSRKLILPRRMAHREGRTTQLTGPMSLSEHANKVVNTEDSLASSKAVEIEMINLCDYDDETKLGHVLVAETRGPSRRAEHVKVEGGAKVKVENVVDIAEVEDDENVNPIPQASPPHVSSTRPAQRSHDDDVEEMELELSAARKQVEAAELALKLFRARRRA